MACAQIPAFYFSGPEKMEHIVFTAGDVVEPINAIILSDEKFVCLTQILRMVFEENGSVTLRNLRKRHDLSKVLVEKAKRYYVNKEGLKLVFSLLRSPKAKEFAVKHLDSLMVQVFGDGKLTEQNLNMLDNLGRFDSISRMFGDHEPEAPEQAAESGISPVTVDSGDYGTYLYVRIALPPDMNLGSVAAEGKLLNARVIKFGITRSPHIRNGEYVRNGHDNGYFAFMFLTTREVACQTESIMRTKLKKHAVYGSFEYVDTDGVASFLGLDKGEGYDYYFYVAECLYAYMLKVCKFIWEDDDNYGVRYLPRQGAAGLCVAGSSAEVSQRLDVTYEAHVLKREHAVAMNIYDANGRVQDLRQPITVEKKTHEVRTAVSACGSAGDGLVLDGNHVIARHIITGQEMVFNNCEETKAHFGISSMKTLLSQRAHFLGWVFHHPQFRRWQPPEGFVFRDLSKEKHKKTNNLGYIKGIDQKDGSVQYFENKAEAALILGYKRDARYIRDFVDKDKADAYGRRWVSCDPSTVGEMVEGKRGFVSTSSCVPSKADARSRGRVVARDIETGEERQFGSSAAAADFFKVNRKVMINDIVDNMRQARGHTFRYADSGRYWEPPPYFKYDKNTYETKLQGFVVQEDRGGQILGLYESQTAASRFLDIPRVTIGDRIRARRAGEDGASFRDARDSECGRWVETGAPAEAEERPPEGVDGGIIVYDYRTGKDVARYKTAEAAKNFFSIDPRLIRKHLVDQPRQCKNLAVRTARNEKRWCPPPCLVTDGEYPDARNEYVVGERDGRVEVMYESITKASSMRGCARLKVGVAGDGLFWRKASRHEFDLWVAASA